jgi:hypothetical protein
MLGSYLNDRILKFKAYLFFLLYGLVLSPCLGFVLIGCQYQSIPPVIEENMMVKQAHQAFLRGDYLLAGGKFRVLSEQTEDSEDQNYGRFGLSCVELATAGDASAFHTALVSFLQHYTRNSTQADSARINVAPPEDFELLIRALEHGSRLMTAEQQVTLNRIAGLKTKNEKQNKEIHKLQALVKILQHQISTLESIDQDLQEKRKNQ